MAKVKKTGKAPKAEKKVTPMLIQATSDSPLLNRQKQIHATLMAKKKKVAESGLGSRVRGHVLANGKRTQAKRDQRGQKDK